MVGPRMPQNKTGKDANWPLLWFLAFVLSLGLACVLIYLFLF